MAWVPFTVGVTVLALATLDFLMSTLGATGRRTFSTQVGYFLYKTFMFTPFGPAKHSFVGVFVLCCVATLWIASFALGWTLILVGASGDILITDTEEMVGFLGVLSHVGHLLSTVGGGLTVPGSMAVALCGVLIGVNGMVVLTISVSMLSATAQTVSTGRALIVCTRHMSPEEFAKSSQCVQSLSQTLSSIAQAPFALYFSHPDPRLRLAPYVGLRTRAIAAHAPEVAELLIQLLPGTHASNSAEARVKQFTQRFCHGASDPVI